MTMAEVIIINNNGNASGPMDFPTIQERIFRTAEMTLREYSNNRVKELGLATKAYKYDFPYDQHYNIRESNYKLAILLEKRIMNRVPYLKANNCRFWTKSKSFISLLLEISPKTERYLRMLNRKLMGVGFPLGTAMSWSRQNVLVVGKNTTMPAYKVVINMNDSLWGRYGLPKILFYFEDVERIFINMHRLGVYESTEQDNPPAEAQEATAAEVDLVGGARRATRIQGGT